MPQARDRRGRSADGKQSSLSGTPVPRKGCKCDELTAVRQLCDVHMAERKRILNRIKHRRMRAKKAGRSVRPIDLEGAVIIPGPAAENTARVLEALAEMQIDTVDAYTRAGKDLPDRYAKMFAYHAALRAALRPVLTQSREELVELRRPTTHRDTFERRNAPYL